MPAVLEAWPGAVQFIPMRHRRGLALGLGLAALGCGTDISGGDIFLIRGVVAGTVTAASGGPVEGAKVIANAHYNPSVLLTDSVETDAGGRYLLTLRVANLPDARAALEMSVRPPSGSGLANRDTTEGLDVLMTRTNPPPETTYVDVELSPP